MARGGIEPPTRAQCVNPFSYFRNCSIHGSLAQLRLLVLMAKAI
jgi:hypothetical protein